MENFPIGWIKSARTLSPRPDRERKISGMPTAASKYKSGAHCTQCKSVRKKRAWAKLSLVCISDQGDDDNFINKATRPLFGPKNSRPGERCDRAGVRRGGRLVSVYVIILILQGAVSRSRHFRCAASTPPIPLLRQYRTRIRNANLIIFQNCYHILR